MKIAVGSTNPVKVSAVRQTILRIWPEADIIPVSVPSGVSDMPMSDEETLAGARNRAAAARERLDADFGIGLEGGVHPEPFGLTLHGWVVVVARNGRIGIGGGGRLPLPDAHCPKSAGWPRTGPRHGSISNDHNTKQKGGAVGALTNGLVLRGETFALAVAYALPRLFRQICIVEQ